MHVVYKYDEFFSFSLEKSFIMWFFRFVWLLYGSSASEFYSSLFLQIISGQVGLRTIWEKYYEEAHAIIYVMDASSPNSFEDAKSALGLFSLSLK